VREAIEKNRFLQLAKKSVNFMLTAFNLGDTIKSVFIKK
jgi:hypothetical protein